MKTTTQESFLAGQGMARRSFLRFAGASAVAAGLMTSISSCKKNDGTDFQPVDIGSGDLAVLNYAYALEQLEAAFYTQVISNPYNGISADERALLTDIRDHEVIHREFFKKALGSNAIPELTPNFSTINFSDRANVLGAAKTFEDLGVAAYNGVGYMIQTVDYLVLAGKIVSVEARHAALIRNLLGLNFADSTILDMNTGLEKSQTPAQVIPQANAFLQGFKISAPGLGA
ncbi:ferritin-like domain-containing protein [uncultured Mucilaginibacter sp.]|uniref:ferritin-like domain-containing protein n=1 Tax=uncultured Mucilaginibacter sp. TaxID=797541 RepID=UPI0025CFE1BA|nr:ferritin-like domain-containing protein [uncultured Mucilaginibacter sp.]